MPQVDFQALGLKGLEQRLIEARRYRTLMIYWTKKTADGRPYKEILAAEMLTQKPAVIGVVLDRLGDAINEKL